MPIFASTDPGPDIYRSVGELENYAEGIDVQNGEWRGYDAVGKPLALTVEGNAVRVAPGIGSAPDQLADWLRSSPLLTHRRDGGWLRQASLVELVDAFDSEERAWREARPIRRLRRWLTRVNAKER